MIRLPTVAGIHKTNGPHRPARRDDEVIQDKVSHEVVDLKEFHNENEVEVTAIMAVTAA